MDEQVASALRLLPNYLGWHVVLSASALLLGLILGLPLALAAAKSRRLRWPLLASASLIQTIPSLALLALFYPLLLALSAVAEHVFGRGFSALGFLPSLLALTLYSMLPILRNGVAGITGVDPSVIEAARGVGMTPRQQLLLVEAPLAAPVVMAGVRTAAVWVIGAATLSTPVGQTSLGDYIFAGLQTENWVFVLFGCAAAAVLALITDQLLALIETGLSRRTRWRVVAGLAGIAIGVVLASAPLLAVGGTGRAYVVGAKNFSEQYILAELMAGRLERTGATVTRRNNLGSAIAFRAVASGEVDAYIDYSGTLWTGILGHTDTPPRALLLSRMADELQRQYGVETLGALGFENAYALAMRRDRAQALGITSIDDLARHAGRLTLGSDLEFLSRPEWAALEKAYGLKFAGERRYQPTFMYKAVGDGTVDVISAFSSDGRIAADDLLVLSDPKGAIPPYDAVLLISPKRRGDAAFRQALKPMVGAVPVEAMREANYAVDREKDKLDPAQAERALSAKLGL